MAAIEFRAATKADAALLNTALRALSHSLGDIHRASDADIARAGFGEDPAFRAVLAFDGATLAGAALYSPVFSTIRGGAGAYVSDLWVAPEYRGTRLGSRLLAHVRTMAESRWGCCFLKLAVAHENARAGAFYSRLGFTPIAHETHLTLEGSALAALESDA